MVQKPCIETELGSLTRLATCVICSSKLTEQFCAGGVVGGGVALLLLVALGYVWLRQAGNRDLLPMRVCCL